MVGPILLFIFFVLLIVGCVRCVCIVQEGYEWVLEFLGRYMTTWHSGLHFKIPVVMKVVKKVSVKQQSADFEPQLMKTADGVNVEVDWVVFFRVQDSHKFTYGVERPIAGIENLSNTTLLSIVGARQFDQIYQDRTDINVNITRELDVATDPWGIKVDRVEIKNIRAANQSVNAAMEQEMIAEREKRAMILRADGQKQSQLTLAEANKEAAILEAQGNAEALLTQQKAVADSIEYINRVNPSDAYLRLEAYKALGRVAQGQATTMFIPTDMVSVVNGMASAIGVGKPVVDTVKKPRQYTVSGQQGQSAVPSGINPRPEQ